MSSIRRAPLNLAELVPALPEVVLPNKKVVQPVPFTARAYELFLSIQEEIQNVQQGIAPSDARQFMRNVDECLALVLPTASADDLAAFGVRTELKLSVILSAAGAVDQVLSALADEVAPRPEGNG